MPKYTVDQVKENLKKLKQKLKDKGRNEGFWVIASRSDFKPLVLEETIKGKTTTKTLVDIDDVKKELLEGKEQYFKNKIFAYIHFFILSNFLTDKEFNKKNIKNIKNEKISGINIDIFKTDDDGKIGTKSINHWQCKVLFTLDDMMDHKLRFSDAEIIMRQVANKLVTTVGLNTINFSNYLQVYEKNLKKFNKKIKKNNFF